MKVDINTYWILVVSSNTNNNSNVLCGLTYVKLKGRSR